MTTTNSLPPLNWFVKSLEDLCAEKIIKCNLASSRLPTHFIENIDKKRLCANVLIKVPTFDAKDCVLKFWKVFLVRIGNSYLISHKVLLLDNLMDSMLAHFQVIYSHQELLLVIITKLNQWKVDGIYAHRASHYLQQIKEEIIAYKLASPTHRATL